MAHKELRFNTDARRALEAGVNKLADHLRAGLEEWCSRNSFYPRRLYGKFLPRQNAERIAPSRFSCSASLRERIWSIL